MLSNAPQSALWSPLATAPAGVQAAYPWEVPPPEAEPFDFFGVLAMPAAGDPEAVVLSFAVPSGYRGVIRDLAHFIEGPSFSQGSGDVVWSLKFDRAYVKNYGAIRVSFGDLTAPRAVYGLKLQPSQVVYYSVLNVAYAPAGTRVICNARGWFYPEVQANVVG